ncbi:MAG: PspC domain-containing protein [Clostridia bacterium]|nr:PspC domain-containing protein [Clostridia bacterium]
MNRRIYLSDTNKKVGGVCGGIGEYFGIDPTLIRLLTVVLTFFTGIVGGVVAYIVAWAIIPQSPKF